MEDLSVLGRLSSHHVPMVHLAGLGSGSSKTVSLVQGTHAKTKKTCDRFVDILGVEVQFVSKKPGLWRN